MPEKSLSSVPPLVILVAAAALFGVIAQVGVTLALGIARSNKQFLGFICLSLVFSGGTTVLLSEVARMKPVVAATLGAMLGAVPSLITLRAGLKIVASQYQVDMTSDLKELEAKK